VNCEAALPSLQLFHEPLSGDRMKRCFSRRKLRIGWQPPRSFSSGAMRSSAGEARLPAARRETSLVLVDLMDAEATRRPLSKSPPRRLRHDRALRRSDSREGARDVQAADLIALTTCSLAAIALVQANLRR